MWRRAPIRRDEATSYAGSGKVSIDLIMPPWLNKTEVTRQEDESAAMRCLSPRYSCVHGVTIPTT
jgi:hypothetical protein